ncbi:Methylenetetrahydrofolate dehydrogenase (NADP+) / Methenyltetrahydrofolate cyclohydrolase [Thermogutta terrifontis]|uniref:Bifunctional protein FolD n=1 Tax=Thermogutta terrifontis TaxID=1331910 RepID=A0A286RE52_9BACT|nr:bifunctional methylenetetrahydrofolate dehydrogenase/methenyltetrahydrofolate cyclohydrolase FolD [Thermogutta terrifontis]ASV74213.1 Methylenetetrahydrofolate dehydrogenase (NADP+) / Methenyltetrahydrofolate cyclohydrolase [Thermogutta terrifontis]
MPAEIIDGKKIAQELREEIRAAVEELKSRYNVVPGLATVLVGDNPASVSYVSAKNRACAELGMRSFQHTLPESTSEDELLSLIAGLNADPLVHGILVQLPLPRGLSEDRVLRAIDPKKDVDGFHPYNVGLLALGDPVFPPCTPAGILELLIRSGTQVEGAEVVVVGRSNIVGKPVALMLMQKRKGANATVTVCHTQTRDLAFHTRRADILIVAAGKPQAVTGDMIRPGATVIDVGVNRIGYTEAGKAKLVGDVDFESAVQIAGKITPVPGGVGPMTITMLMRNTLRAARLSLGLNLDD